MRRWRLVLVAAMVAAVPAVAVAQGTEFDSVTGGGQVDLDPLQTVTEEGPGDTITFSAQQSPGAGTEFGDLAATGEVEWIDRRVTDGQQGRNQGRIHGDVVCLGVAGRKAVIGYRSRTDAGTTDPRVDQLTVYDNEEPLDDLVINDFDAEFPCAVNMAPVGPDVQLARGEVRIHDAE